MVDSLLAQLFYTFMFFIMDACSRNKMLQLVNYLLLTLSSNELLFGGFLAANSCFLVPSVVQ